MSFDPSTFIMGLVGTALVATTGLAWRSVNEKVSAVAEAQKRSAQDTAAALREFGDRFTVIEHTVFGVKGAGGHGALLEHHGEKLHRHSNALAAVGPQVGLEFDENGRASPTAHPPLLASRLDHQPVPRVVPGGRRRVDHRKKGGAE